MPKNLFGFVLLMGRHHQIAIAALSILLFLAGIAPLEVQRRIINAATGGASYLAILILVFAYLGLALLEGLTKLALNLYRGWIGEVAIRWLRMGVLAASECSHESPVDALAEGVQLSIVLAKAEPVGIFALGGYYFVTGKTEIGTVVAFISGLSKITDPWGNWSTGTATSKSPRSNTP